MVKSSMNAQEMEDQLYFLLGFSSILYERVGKGFFLYPTAVDNLESKMH